MAASNLNEPSAVALTIAAPGILSNDTDANDNPLTAILDSGPNNGTLALNADGSLDYTPNAGFTGDDSFTYHANDGTVDSNIATVTITVNEVNVAPAAADDAYSTDEDTVLIIPIPGVLDNDTDNDGDTLTAIIDSNPTSGTLSLNADGSLSYTPNAGFFGADSFTYHANDGTANSNVATVTVTVKVATAFATCGGYDVFETAPGVYAAPSFAGALYVGTNGRDKINGTNSDDLIIGLSGNDKINGKKGNDVICGGDGHDWLFGHKGNDFIDGGSGWDDLIGHHGMDELVGGGGFDILLGGHDNDQLWGEDGPDWLFGQWGDDTLDGGSDRDFCRGNSGADTIANCEGASAAAADSDIADVSEEDELSDEEVELLKKNDMNEKLFLPLVSK